VGLRVVVDEDDPIADPRREAEGSEVLATRRNAVVSSPGSTGRESACAKASDSQANLARIRHPTAHAVLLLLAKVAGTLTRQVRQNKRPGIVGQRVEERHESAALGRMERHRADLRGPARTVGAARHVEIDDGPERGNRAVVHARRPHGDVA